MVSMWKPEGCGGFAGEPNSFRILAADFVTTEQGTGFVHVAPGHHVDVHERTPIVIGADLHPRRGISDPR